MSSGEVLIQQPPFEAATAMVAEDHWQRYEGRSRVVALSNLLPFAGLRKGPTGRVETATPEDAIAVNQYLAETTLAGEQTRVPYLYEAPYSDVEPDKLTAEQILARNDAYAIVHASGYTPIPYARFVSEEDMYPVKTADGYVVNSHDIQEEHVIFNMGAPLEMQEQLTELAEHGVEVRLEDSERIMYELDAGSGIEAIVTSPHLLDQTGSESRPEWMVADVVQMPWGRAKDYHEWNPLRQIEATTGSIYQSAILNELIGLDTAETRDQRMAEYLALADLDPKTFTGLHGQTSAEVAHTGVMIKRIRNMLTEYTEVANMNSRYRKTVSTEDGVYKEEPGRNLSEEEMRDGGIRYALGVLRVAHKLAKDPLPIEA